MLAMNRDHVTPIFCLIHLATLKEHTALAAYILQVLGFVINWEKSELDPMQRIIYVGYLIDSIRMTINLPEETIRKLK